MNETSFIENLDRYTSFRIKFFCQVDRCMQQFISSCSNASEVEDVDFDLIDISYIHLSFIRQHFFCDIPTSFAVNKRPNDHSQHFPNIKSKQGYRGVINIKSPNISWKLKNNRSYEEVFANSGLKCPIIEKNRYFCRSQASIVYCFKYCQNSGSNFTSPNEVNYFYNCYQNKCREISANINCRLGEASPLTYCKFKWNWLPPPRNKASL